MAATYRIQEVPDRLETSGCIEQCAWLSTQPVRMFDGILLVHCIPFSQLSNWSSLRPGPLSDSVSMFNSSVPRHHSRTIEPPWTPGAQLLPFSVSRIQHPGVHVTSGPGSTNCSGAIFWQPTLSRTIESEFAIDCRMWCCHYGRICFVGARTEPLNGVLPTLKQMHRCKEGQVFFSSVGARLFTSSCSSPGAWQVCCYFSWCEY